MTPKVHETKEKIDMLDYINIEIFKNMLFIFRERGRDGERGRDTLMCGCPSSTPQLGTWHPTQACALTGNQTSDPLVCRLALKPLGYTSQDKI